MTQYLDVHIITRKFNYFAVDKIKSIQVHVYSVQEVLIYVMNFWGELCPIFELFCAFNAYLSLTMFSTIYCQMMGDWWICELAHFS